MSELSFTGDSTITLDGAGAVTIEFPALTVNDGGSLNIRVLTHNVFGHSALVIAPGDCWNTVYRDASTNYLFILRGEWDEEKIDLVYDAARTTLEKVCVLSPYQL